LLSIYLDKSVAGAIDVTLTAAESNYHIIDVGGAITANINVIVPSAAGQWTFKNTTTGAFTVTVKTAAGTGVTVPQAGSSILYSDGVNVYNGADSLGTGQTWQARATPAPSTTYTNTSGKPISVSVYYQITAAVAVQANFTVNGVIVDTSSTNFANGYGTARCIVPAGGTYSLAPASGTMTIGTGTWMELK
jgi:hypothetical protein